MTIRAAVIACVRMGMDWRTVALAYRLPYERVWSILRSRHETLRGRTAASASAGYTSARPADRLGASGAGNKRGKRRKPAGR